MPIEFIPAEEPFQAVQKEVSQKRPRLLMN